MIFYDFSADFCKWKICLIFHDKRNFIATLFWERLIVSLVNRPRNNVGTAARGQSVSVKNLSSVVRCWNMFKNPYTIVDTLTLMAVGLFI